ncbi:MAG TPA: zf-HC2 domain-containing protein [Phycisphaerales bacterium]|nr:zf-HC2 domain-containing protein [Phycisphaerales bacterium]HRQ74849.1 zf-HC2 domain-containing protein [Phycisphaerales bacterium]
MQTMDCTDIKALLSPYLDDELDAESRHLMERHLGTCASCRSFVDEAERLDGLLLLDAEQRTQSTSLSPEFIGAVMSRTVYADPPSRLGSLWINWAGWTAAAAALTLAALLWVQERSQPLPVQMAGIPTITLETPEETVPRTVRTLSYATGAGLRSQTYDGVMPIEQILGVSLRHDAAMMAANDVSVAAAAEEPVVQPSTTLIIARPVIAREDAETFYATSLVLEALADADLDSFADVERVRRITEFDELLPRLHQARYRVDAADRPAVLAAESLLVRVVQGPINADDVRILRDTVAQLQLSEEMGEMSLRWSAPSS